MWTVEERREFVLPAASVLSGYSQGSSGRRRCSSRWEAEEN